jgi:uncharacterized protein YndB with AHSA1/START domain
LFFCATDNCQWRSYFLPSMLRFGEVPFGPASLRGKQFIANKVVISSQNTIHLHRVLAAKPEKVYRAFLDAAALARWLPPEGYTCMVHSLDATVGGVFKMSFTNFTNGESHSFGGRYLELVPNERLRYTDVFDDPNLPGEMIVTVVLKEVSCGTDLTITQENIPAVIPIEHCYLGWQQSLQFLAKIVEPDIK